MSGELDGYWPSPWPCEDGGPNRRQTPAPSAHFSLAARRRVTNRQVFGANMVVLRDPDEVYLQGNTLGGPDTTSWVERIDPMTLEPLERSPDLSGGPFWAGGVAAHRNGHLYVTYGRWCHKLHAVSLEPVESIELPRPRPYNSLLVLPDGHLVMKDFCGGTGVHAIADDSRGSELIVLDPDTLALVDRFELPEGSIARISADGIDASPDASIYVVGDQGVHTLRWDAGAQRLSPNGTPRQYVRHEGQTFGWDAVIVDGSAWLLDNGEGTATFGPSFRGKGVSPAPLHLVRIDLLHPTAEPTLTEVCGEPNGIVANPPAVDPIRRIAVGYDSSNGVVAAFRYPADPSQPLEPLWRRDQHHGGHMLIDSGAGTLLTYDFDHERGTDQVVTLDLETGDVIDRSDTGSVVQTVLFPAPGWHDDFYAVSFTTISRFHA